MAILAVGGGFETFTLINGAPTWNTTGGVYDALGCRGSVDCAGFGEGVTSRFTGQTDLWFSFYVYNQNIDGGTDSVGILVRDNANSEDIFRLVGTGSGMTLQYWDGASWTSIGAEMVEGAEGMTDATLYRVDMHLVLDNSSGSIDMYQDGNLLRSYSGDTIFGSTVSADEISFEHFRNDTSGGTHYSGIIIADEDTRGLRLNHHTLDGNSGTNTAWTGDYTDVDEDTTSDADLIVSTTASQIEGFTFDSLNANFADWDVHSVVLASRARNDGGAAPQNIRHHIRSGSTDYYAGSNFSGLTTSFLGGYQDVFATDPDTASAWTQSGVNAAEAGVDSVT